MQFIVLVINEQQVVGTLVIDNMVVVVIVKQQINFYLEGKKCINHTHLYL